MDDLKTYSPQTIEDNPFPNSEVVDLGSSQSSSKEIYSSENIKDQKLPQKIISTELISTVLNTKSRKILGEFEFTEHGAIRIGKYTNGVSGDIRITPNGITARDLSGLTTFSIDGDTGDAVFKGQIQSGSVVTGVIQAEVLEITGGGIIGVATEGFRSEGGFSKIQDAIDWVNGFGGGEVNIPNGTYILTADITLYSNISIIGQDNDKTIIDCNNGAYSFILTDLTNTQIQNITIKRSSTNSIEINNCDYCFVQDIIFLNNSGDLYILNGTKNSNFLSLNIKDTTNSAIKIDNINNCILEDIKIENCNKGLEIVGAFLYSEVDHVIILNSVSYGIELSNGYIEYSNIMKCIIRNGSSHGIYLKEPDRCIFTNNIINGNAGSGIYLDGAAGLIINNNNIGDNGGYGIHISNISNDNDIVGNFLQWNTSGAINNLGTDNIIASNRD